MKGESELLADQRICQAQSSIEIEARSDQLVLETIVYLDPDYRDREENVLYRQDAESLITLGVLLGGAFVSYSIILLHLLN